MSDDTRDISQLRAVLKDYILDAETEIRANLKVGIFRGQSDPTVVRMQQVVDDLIAKVRKEARAAALRDAARAVEEVVDDMNTSAEWCRDYDVDETGQTRNPRILVREAIAAIEALGGER